MPSCTRIPLPLPAAIIGDGNDVLVAEISDPYRVAVEVLRSNPRQLVGLVVWGAGRSLPITCADAVDRYNRARSRTRNSLVLGRFRSRRHSHRPRCSPTVNGYQWAAAAPGASLFGKRWPTPDQNIGEINWPQSDSGGAWPPPAGRSTSGHVVSRRPLEHAPYSIRLVDDGRNVGPWRRVVSSLCSPRRGFLR